MSKITKIPISDLERAVKESYSAAETCRKLNLSDRSGTITRLKRYVLKNNIDISHWTGRLWAKGKTSLDDKRIRTNKSTEDIFSENSNASPSYVRKLIRKKNLLDYMCQICKMGPTWNGQELRFQLDHINGKRSDHRLENLRWLCPNCHTQTETYGGKNKAAKSNKISDSELLTALENCDNIRQALISVGLENGRNYKRAKSLLKKYGLVGELVYPTDSRSVVCEDIVGSSPTKPTTLLDRNKIIITKSCSCGKEITNLNRKFCSEICYHKSTRKIDWDAINLEEEIKTKSILSLAKELGVSDNAIHKILKRMGIKKRRGFV